ncbi:SoxR reducing system RseC family protein [candidate division WOR-3 bacterium]|nr:SoxR reducing system RseC family protein [candidate division WOR-3 bacterium]MCK4334498.1 SoxR reducing system RseC family protein [candidate division WOR-3 bacterium]
MIKEKEQGEVIDTEGNLVRVRMSTHGVCGTCGHKAICFLTGDHRVLIARAEPGIHEGDLVSIDFPSGPSIISSLLIFVGSVFVPLLVWLVAEFAGAPLLLKVVSVVGALVIYWVFLVALNRRLKRSGWFLPRAYKSAGEVIIDAREQVE